MVLNEIDVSRLAATVASLLLAVVAAAWWLGQRLGAIAPVSPSPKAVTMDILLSLLGAASCIVVISLSANLLVQIPVAIGGAGFLAREITLVQKMLRSKR